MLSYIYHGTFKFQLRSVLCLSWKMNLLESFWFTIFGLFFFQTFNAIFEAAIEGVATNQARGKNLTFEVSGDGNLPRINIQKPTVRNKRGQALMLFKKNLVNHSETMPLVLVNDGTLPSKVDIDLIDQDGVFQLKPVEGTNAVMDDDYEGIY